MTAGRTRLGQAAVTQITAGSSSACALSVTGAVYCWGAGSSGQLGNGTDKGSDVPVAVTAPPAPRCTMCG